MNDPNQDFAAAKLKQMADSLDIPLDLLGQRLSPALQDEADAIGDQCCADLETIAHWQRERGR